MRSGPRSERGGAWNQLRRPPNATLTLTNARGTGICHSRARPEPADRDAGCWAVSVKAASEHRSEYTDKCVSKGRRS